MKMTHRRAGGLDLLLFYPLGLSCEQGVRLPTSLEEKPSRALLSCQRTFAATSASKTSVASMFKTFSPCFQRHGYRYVRPKYKTSTMPKTTVTMHAMISVAFLPTSVIRRNVVRPEGANVIPSSFSCGQVESAMDTVNKSQGRRL